MKKTKVCVDCEQKTKNYYPVSTNKGKIYKCAECYELNIIIGECQINWRKNPVKYFFYFFNIRVR